MTHWHFVIAAYAVTGTGTFVLLLASLIEMIKAEKSILSLEQ
jgi:hypothetical protein